MADDFSAEVNVLLCFVIPVKRTLRKGQAEIPALHGGIVGKARIVERAFGVGPCVLSETMGGLQDRLASAES